MLPGLGGKMDPKQMASLMRQLGIKSEELDVARVTIEKTDGSRILVEPASVTKIVMQGQATYQVAGVSLEQKPGEGAPREKSDVELVMEQTGASREEAEKALKGSGGDIAEAILSLEAGRG